MGIRVEHITKRFGSFVAVQDVSLQIRPGELSALLGPSGGGKSTILRIISGLETADEGRVVIDGQSVDHLHARARNIGFVFQHYALFRHMTVAQNIGFGLEVRKAPKESRRRRVADLIDLLGLQGLEDRLPSQLSGGQRQRVAVARALAPEPKVLLLDEPFSAVDAQVREELRRWLRRLHDDLHVTSIFVTHDQSEAFSVADRVFIINEGRLEQSGTPLEVLDDPATEFVARFLGEVNVYDGRVHEGFLRVGPIEVAARDVADGTPMRMILRAYDLKLWREEPGVGVVRRVLLLGDRVKVEAVLDGAGPLFAQFPRRSSLLKGIEPGCRIAVEVSTARLYPLPADPPGP
ncbi:MAG: sulfate ABC transporter ATP-binding protein [Deltaproteobacteria bacterium]|nr:sulfate ABC transporter ATP-binding protein [Deltaproteobacteria bacterium]